MPTSRPILAVAALAVLAGALPARPRPTPLAKLVYPGWARGFPGTRPSYLPVELSTLTSLGEFHTARRDDGLIPEPRLKGVVAPGHRYHLGQGVLVYSPGGPDGVEVVGTGKVIEMHALPGGFERLVLAFRTRYLHFETHGDEQAGTGIYRALWEAGLGPDRVRYFTYPSNLLGMPQHDYERLAAGKIWVGMSRDQARLVMGSPMRVAERRTAPWGWREVWRFPRSFGDTTFLIFANDQLRAWQDSWVERQAEADRWSWQARPTKNPWVGRDSLF